MLNKNTPDVYMQKVHEAKSKHKLDTVCNTPAHSLDLAFHQVSHLSFE